MKGQVCGHDREDLSHFILWCPACDQPRQKNKTLRQPREEDEEKVIGRLLFEENIREAKETIYEFWKMRKMHLEIKHHSDPDSD